MTAPPPAYWSNHRDGTNVTARLRAEVDAAAASTSPPRDDDVAAAAAWERLDDMRRLVGKDTMPDVWAVDPERAERLVLVSLEADMRDAVTAVSRKKLVESAAPTHPPYRILVDALSMHAAREEREAAATAAVGEHGEVEEAENTAGAAAAATRVSPEAFAATWNETLRLRDNRHVTLPEAAAIMLRYGVSAAGGKGRGGGVMAPVEPLARALLGAPSRVTGKLPLMDNRSKGVHGFDPSRDDPNFAGKILYPKTNKGVFAPGDFDPADVTRSARLPKARLELEHCHGYDGFGSVANNVLFNAAGEVVYYAAALGVVYNVETRRQRFFHGHDRDVKCIAMHPNKSWVATGQTGVEPWVCVWDTATCHQLQRLSHPAGTRGIVCVGFSREPLGERLAACGADDAHTIFVWDWMKNSPGGNDPNTGEPIPMPRSGHGYGPEKSLLRARAAAAAVAAAAASAVDEDGREKKQKKEEEEVVEVEQPPGWGDDASGGELVVSVGGKAGVPPNVWGLVWDPVHTGQLLMYGVKHVITLSESAEEPGKWEQTVGLFGATQPVDNVTSAVFVPDPCAKYRVLTKAEDTGAVRFSTGATRVTDSGWVVGPPPDESERGGAREVVLARQEPGLAGAEDTLLLTGFPSGDVGAWVRASPSSARLLLRRIAAHVPGPVYPLPDGSLSPAGVRALVLCSDGVTVLSGGADGTVRRWAVKQTAPDEDWIAEVGVGEERPSPLNYAGEVAASARWDGRLRLRLVPVDFDPSTSSSSIPSSSDQVEWSLCALRSPLRGTALGVRGLGVRCGDGTVVLGTDTCDLWMVRHPSLATDGVVTGAEEGAGAGAGEEEDASRGEAASGEQPPPTTPTPTRLPPPPPPAPAPEQIVGGHLADVRGVAAHPTKPLFVTAAETPRVCVWNAETRVPVAATSVGFTTRSTAFSACGSHLAVGGRCGKVRVLVTATLKPLQLIVDAKGTVDCVKYSPDNRVLAVGSHDLVVYLYDTGFRRGVSGAGGGGGGEGKGKGKGTKGTKGKAGGGGDGSAGTTTTTSSWPVVAKCWERGLGGKGEYSPLARCHGHSAALSHLDFSLPLSGPTPDLVGRVVLRSSSTPGREVLVHDAVNGKLINANVRDAKWATFTSNLGFAVMGIWPDGAGAADVWTACRTNSGAPPGRRSLKEDENKKKPGEATQTVAAAAETKTEMAGGVVGGGDDGTGEGDICPGGVGSSVSGYVVTGDVFSRVKLHAFPCVADDAPFQECLGHSSFVTEVCVTADDRWAVSVGGRDRTALQWRIVTPPTSPPR